MQCVVYSTTFFLQPHLNAFTQGYELHKTNQSRVPGHVRPVGESLQGLLPPGSFQCRVPFYIFESQLSIVMGVSQEYTALSQHKIRLDKLQEGLQAEAAQQGHAKTACCLKSPQVTGEEGP